MENLLFSVQVVAWFKDVLVDKRQTCLQDFVDRSLSLGVLSGLFVILLRMMLGEVGSTFAAFFPSWLASSLLLVCLLGCSFLIVLTVFGLSVVTERLPGQAVDVSGWSLPKKWLGFALGMLVTVPILLFAFMAAFLVLKM